MSRTKLVLATLFLLVLALGGGLAWLRPHSFHGTVIQSPEAAPDFTLTAAGGRSVSLHDFQGKVVLLYFGYTFCPDVCPATLGNLAQALRMLGKQAEQVQVIMISVDPERDTPEKLAEYVAHFHPSFIGVTASPEEIAQVAALYGIFYQKHAGSTAEGYLIDHTASVMLIDRQGRLKVVFPFGVSAEEFAEDLKAILRR